MEKENMDDYGYIRFIELKLEALESRVKEIERVHAGALSLVSVLFETIIEQNENAIKNIKNIAN